MLKKLLYSLVFMMSTQQLLSQTQLPIIKATSKSAKIKDGNKITGWSLSPEAKPDVFVANRTRKTTKITFYTDIDSMVFVVKPYQKFSFVVLLNNKDTCYTVIQSAVQESSNKRLSATKFVTDTIPFTLTDYNNISIKTIVNQRDTLNLMFHSGVGSVYVTKEGLAKTKYLKVDKSDFINVKGSVMDKKVRFPTSVLGNDVLKRFNVLVDFQNDFIYLKPNKLINMPYRNGV